MVETTWRERCVPVRNEKVCILLVQTIVWYAPFVVYIMQHNNGHIGRYQNQLKCSDNRGEYVLLGDEINTKKWYISLTNSLHYYMALLYLVSHVCGIPPHRFDCSYSLWRITMPISRNWRQAMARLPFTNPFSRRSLKLRIPSGRILSRRMW